jgi:hypothetical protein
MRPVMLAFALCLAAGCSCDQRSAVQATIEDAGVTSVADAATPEPVAKKSQPALLRADFTGPLAAAEWVLWRHHLDEKSSSFQPTPKGIWVDLETYGRKPEEVSVMGLGSKRLFDWSERPITIEVELDWLEPDNASYLSAGLAIVPEGAELTADPRDLAAVTSVAIIGVSPAVKVRREWLVQLRHAEIFRDTEGWPEQGKEGRTMQSTRLRLTVGADAMRLEEDGREPLSAPTGPGFTRGRVVLFLASHSNSMRRAVRFTALVVR